MKSIKNESNPNAIYYGLRRFPELKKSYAQSEQLNGYNKPKTIREKSRISGERVLQMRPMTAEYSNVKKLDSFCASASKDINGYSSVRKDLLQRKIQFRREPVDKLLALSRNPSAQQAPPRAQTAQVNPLRSACRKLAHCGLTDLEHATTREDFVSGGLLAVLQCSDSAKLSAQDFQARLVTFLGVRLTEVECLGLYSIMYPRA